MTGGDGGPATTGLALAPASSFDVGTLARVVTDSFQDYFVEIRADAASLARMIRCDGVDLHASSVVEREGTPVGVVLVALRGWAARIVAMGIVPDARGSGLGTWALERVLEDLDGRDVRATWLEVIEANTAGVRLYEGKGFERVRRLIGFSIDAETARRIAEADEGLAVVDIRDVGAAMTAGAAADLPWQVSGESLAQGAPPSRGYELGEAMCVISDPAQERIALTGIIVAPEERRCGEATRLVRALLAEHPGRAWRVAEIMPEHLGGLFGGLGFERSSIAQLQLRRGP